MNLRLLLCGLSCCFVLTACGGEDSSSPPAQPTSQGQEETGTTTAAPEMETEGAPDGLDFPMEGEHKPEGEPLPAPPLPPGAKAE